MTCPDPYRYPAALGIARCRTGAAQSPMAAAVHQAEAAAPRAQRRSNPIARDSSPRATHLPRIGGNATPAMETRRGTGRPN